MMPEPGPAYRRRSRSNGTTSAVSRKKVNSRSRIAATTAVVALMVASEKVSFSRVIDGQPVLRAIDRWGRPQ